MSEQKIKLATFKVNGDRWTEFVSKAAKQHTNASALLKQFIDRYLSGIDGIDERLDVEPIAPASNINCQIDQALAPIRQEIEELRQTILQNQPQELKNQGNTHSSIDKPVAEPSEGEKLGDRRLSLSEAYELAKGRGYTKAMTSMNRDLTAGKLAQFGVGIVDKPERQIGYGARNYVELGKG